MYVRSGKNITKPNLVGLVALEERVTIMVHGVSSTLLSVLLVRVSLCEGQIWRDRLLQLSQGIRRAADGDGAAGLQYATRCAYLYALCAYTQIVPR